ncbi:hypothetical protein FQN57_004714 [Myotisia sp. PD_48]|nr:hypothetical protein FQN57_004714 [Myotisia sp. PD_48]
MGMYEPLRLVSDTYPGVPHVRAQGAMALVIAVSILWALIWLTYRAYQVCTTPNDLLVEKLGLDIPPTPEVTLEEIGARELRIAWKYPELQNSVNKHSIQVNGVKVGESKRSETAASIFNLLPCHIYHICVIAISAGNFQTSSAVLHVRTCQPQFSSDRCEETSSGDPLVQAYVPKAGSVTSPCAPVMSREQNGGPSQVKRAGGGRKSVSSGAINEFVTHQQPDGRSGNDECEESVEELAERLKGLQHENETLDKQIDQEDKEYEDALRELEEQRNCLKQRVKEKDDASGDLRKHVNKLENVNRAVQSERTKREKLLQQKEAERKKRAEDIIRWNDKTADIRNECSVVQAENTRLDEQAAKRIEKFRLKITSEQLEMKKIDEEIKIKGSRIKVLEEERRRLEGGDNEEAQELDRLEKERERFWDIKIANLRAQYTSLLSVHSQAQQQYFEAQERLKWVAAQYSISSSVPFGPVPAMDLELPVRTSSHRRTRHRSSLTSNMSSPINYPLVDTSFPNPNFSQVGNNSPTFPAVPAFFNINNGMTIPDPAELSSPVRTESGNPPMSPRADALLPSDLLGDEEHIPEEPSIGTPFSTIGVPAGLLDGALPNSPSPVSSGSGPTSLFASPHGSLNNLHEMERNSVQAAAAISQPPPDAAQSASRRLSGLFGFNRQRGKTMADPPFLGSLKPGQSQSFPRNLDQGLDPIGTRRRRLSYTANWANPMTNFFPRNSSSNVTGDSASDHLPAGRRAMFPNFFTSGRLGNSFKPSHADISDETTGYNQFSPRHDPIDPSILGTVRRNSLSPRPSSTYSFEKALPRPKTENQPFGWPSSDKTRNSGLDWLSPAAWSRSQSRRPSFQMGSTGHLPLGMPTELEYPETPFEHQRPVQAPIGTRPPSSHRPVTPKLDPTAPSFKTLFGKKQDKSKSKEAKDHENNTAHEEISPPDSRRSRDFLSIRTSATESRESLERVSSSTPSETVSTKESFIQKITRKGSSSKFNMPWKDRAGLFAKKGEPSNQAEMDEDGNNEIHLGKSNESAISTSLSGKGSLGFGFIRKAKKADKAPSESSKASEAGDESIFSDRYSFRKPNDIRALDLMNAAAQAVMKDIPDLTVAYGVSDEFSFVFHRTSQLFERRNSKLVSTIVSTFTAHYIFLWPSFFPGVPLQPTALPTFDGRAVQYPSVKNLRDYMSWRQVDCHINNLYNTTFWAMVQCGGMSNKDAETELQGTVSSDKNEILFSRYNINYNNEPEIFRKGSVLFRDYELEPASEGQTTGGMGDDGEVDEPISKTQLDKQQKLRRKANIAIYHVDIIKDEFWELRPWLLSNRPGKLSNMS